MLQDRRHLICRDQQQPDVININASTAYIAVVLLTTITETLKCVVSKKRFLNSFTTEWKSWIFAVKGFFFSFSFFSYSSTEKSEMFFFFCSNLYNTHDHIVFQWQRSVQITFKKKNSNFHDMRKSAIFVDGEASSTINTQKYESFTLVNRMLSCI